MLINLRVDDLKRKKDNEQKGELDTSNRLAGSRALARDRPKLLFPASTDRPYFSDPLVYF